MSRRRSVALAAPEHFKEMTGVVVVEASNPGPSTA